MGRRDSRIPCGEEKVQNRPGESPRPPVVNTPSVSTGKKNGTGHLPGSVGKGAPHVCGTEVMGWTFSFMVHHGVDVDLPKYLGSSF